MSEKFCKDCKWFKTNKDVRLKMNSLGIYIDESNWCSSPHNTFKDLVLGEDKYRYPLYFLRDDGKDGECGKEGRWFEIDGNTKG